MIRRYIKSISKASVGAFLLAIVLTFGVSCPSASALTADEYWELLATELLMNEGIDVSQLSPDDPYSIEILWIYVDGMMGIIPPENQAEVDALYQYYLNMYGL